MNSNMITGLTGAPIFYGVVENRNDPMKLGRVQVRIIGLHSALKQGNDNTGEGISTPDLPWALPLQNITSAAMNGIGNSPTGILEGTHVIGISRDGRMYNDLIILGTLGGIPEEAPNGQAGFNDPSNTYPKEAFLNEPDTNRLARNEKIDSTIHQLKKDSLDKAIPNANQSGQWDEPASDYNAEYPYNHVQESESGHTIEIDDTKGSERLHTYHKTGTFQEINSDGSRVTKIVGDDYEIVHSGKHLHVKGVLNITVDGDAALFIKGNVEEEVTGNVNRVVDGNITELVKGNINRTVKGSVTEEFQSNKSLAVTGSDTETSASKNSTVSGSETNKSGNLIVDGGSTIKMTAARVDIN